MWRLALRTLVYDRLKFLTALTGVVFSVVLMNVQGGLFVGLIRKASLLVDHAQADIWVGHRGIDNVDFPYEIPRAWRERIRTVPGVARVEPIIVGHSVMSLSDGGFEPVLVVGAEPLSRLAIPWGDHNCGAAEIRRPDAIIVDQYDLPKLAHPRIDERREIARRQARLVAHSRGVLGFLVTPYVITTLDRAIGYLGKRPSECSYFLVGVQPDHDPAQVCTAIRAQLPDVDAYTNVQYSWRSIQYWLQRTGLGISFGAATALGLFVGLVIVAQTLYASILDRLPEFAALKALGAREATLRRMILIQAGALGLLGSLVGLVAVAVIQRLFHSPRAPIAIPWYVSAGSCLLVIGLCLGASLLPYLRIRRIEPALVLSG